MNACAYTVLFGKNVESDNTIKLFILLCIKNCTTCACIYRRKLINGINVHILSTLFYAVLFPHVWESRCSVLLTTATAHLPHCEHYSVSKGISALETAVLVHDISRWIGERAWRNFELAVVEKNFDRAEFLFVIDKSLATAMYNDRCVIWCVFTNKLSSCWLMMFSSSYSAHWRKHSIKTNAYSCSSLQGSLKYPLSSSHSTRSFTLERTHSLSIVSHSHWLTSTSSHSPSSCTRLYLLHPKFMNCPQSVLTTTCYMYICSDQHHHII